jgi:DNA-binding NtrC family response regulator
MKTPRVLIIDDEVALARALGEVCERLGACVVLCASGERGLQELSSGGFALVGLDIGLPDMSGLAVLEAINQSAPRPTVLIITAHGSLDNAVAARQLGAADYLVKPLDLPLLEQTLSQLLVGDGTSGEHWSVQKSGLGAEETSALLGGASPCSGSFWILHTRP